VWWLESGYIADAGRRIRTQSWREHTSSPLDPIRPLASTCACRAAASRPPRHAPSWLESAASQPCVQARARMVAVVDSCSCAPPVATSHDSLRGLTWSAGRLSAREEHCSWTGASIKIEHCSWNLSPHFNAGRGYLADVMHLFPILMKGRAPANLVKKT
jgi:hypothetical protein